jgi:hypothetical protein
MSPGIPLPPDIHDYLCDFLEGKIRKPSGRKPDSENPLAHLKKALIPAVYDRHLTELRRQRRENKSKGLGPIYRDKLADWATFERAAQMTIQELGLKMELGTVLNIVSKSKN